MKKDTKFWEDKQKKCIKKKVSWSNFDSDMNEYASTIDSKKYVGIYAIPRGGLVLGVKLSHLLGLPLLLSPCDKCLIVDDILDSGETVKPLLQKFEKTCAFYFWFVLEKSLTDYWSCITFTNVKKKNYWLTFPWE